MPTAYQYTGQLSQMEEVGLYHYGAKWFDPAGAHFTQADTLIPELYNPLDWDRYAYGRGNPLKYTDPTGHMVASDNDKEAGCNTPGSTQCIFDKYYGTSTDTQWFLDLEFVYYLDAYPDYDISKDPNLWGPEKTAAGLIQMRKGCGEGNAGACAGMAIVSVMTSPGIVTDEYIPATSENRSFRRDVFGDPDCVGCGYQSPSMQLRGKYAPSYVQKIQETYRSIRGQGIDITEHGINRLLGRSSRGVTTVNVVDAYYNGKLYTDPAYGTNVRFRNGVALSIDPLSGKIINVQTQTNPTSRWIPIE